MYWALWRQCDYHGHDVTCDMCDCTQSLKHPCQQRIGGCPDCRGTLEQKTPEEKVICLSCGAEFYDFWEHERREEIRIRKGLLTPLERFRLRGQEQHRMRRALDKLLEKSSLQEQEKDRMREALKRHPDYLE